MKLFHKPFRILKFYKKLIFSSLVVSSFLISACSQANQPVIDKNSNNKNNLSSNFNLNNLNKNDLLKVLFLGNTKVSLPSLIDATANHLIKNWVKDFLADKNVDRGSELFRTQEKIKSSLEKITSDFEKALNSAESKNYSNNMVWQQAFQKELDPFGGTKEGWIINKLTPGITGDLINSIFSKLYLSYEDDTGANITYKSQVSDNQINTPENWSKIKFFPSTNDLAIGNEIYQKQFANFQAFVFNQWVENEHPFLVWDLNWKYENSALSSMANIYNQQNLGTNDVVLPATTDYNFPAFNIGDGSTNAGDLASFNAWQTSVKSNAIIDKKTGGILLGDVFSNDSDNSQINKSWKIYENSTLASEADGYLSSSVAHQYNKLFDNNSKLVNEIDLSSDGKDWKAEQKSNPLLIFLDKEEDSKGKKVETATNEKVGIKINNSVIFNQSNNQFKDQNFIYPIRDIKTKAVASESVVKTDSSEATKSLWTLAKTKSGFNAISIDGGALIAQKTSIEEKLKQIKVNLLRREALFFFNPNPNNKNINIDLLGKIKDYATKNFSSLVVKYAKLQKNDSNKLKDLTNNNLFFSQKQNFLLSNNDQLVALVDEIEKYKKISDSQRNLVIFRNSLSSTVSPLAGKIFKKVDEKIYAPYENGLATPLAFKRNLNIVKSDPIFSLTPNDSEKKEGEESYQNNGDYPDVTKIFSSDKINNQHANFQMLALSQAHDKLSEKMADWLKALKSSNESIYWNKNLFYLNSLEFNFAYNKILNDKKSLNLLIENAYLANSINYNYDKNQFNFKDLKLNNVNGNSVDGKDTNNDYLKTAIQQIIYSSIYTGSVNNINNGKDFIGGYEIKLNSDSNDKKETTSSEDNNKTNITNYINKVTSYWNQAFYSFNDLGKDLTSDINSHYIRTLFSVDWLLKNEFRNLIAFLKTQITYGNYGAIVWAQENNLNNNANVGLAENASNSTEVADKTSVEKIKNFRLKDYKNFDFVPNPGNVLTSPYFSYDLSGSDKIPISNSSPQNYISANAPIKINGTDTNNLYQQLSGFYGLSLKNKTLGIALPEVVSNAVFNEFTQANPAGNLSIFSPSSSDKSNENKMVQSPMGKLYGLAFKNAQNKPDVQVTINHLIAKINSVQTFAAFNSIANQLAAFFPEISNNINKIVSTDSYQQIDAAKDANGNVILNKWTSSTTLPALQITLKQKINALINALNGQNYFVDTSNSNEVLLKNFGLIYNQVYKKKADFNLFKESDISRFSGALQNPKSESSIYPNLKYFIENADNSRTGYIVYAMQVNWEDVNNVTNFKAFTKILGIDAFFKMVIYLAQLPQIQNDAINSFVFSNQFKRLETHDQRVVNSLGTNWAVYK